MNIDGKPVVLAVGAHVPADGDGCLMEWTGVAWLVEHGWSFDAAWAELSDQPACTDPMVTSVAQVVNDLLDDVERQRLVSLIPRLARCASPSDPVKARRVRVRVACWAVRGLFDRTDDVPPAAVVALEAVEAWLRGEATAEGCRLAAVDASYASYGASAVGFAAAAAADAAHAAAADAASAVGYAAADAASAVGYAAYAAAHATDPVAWFTDFLDAWDKAIAEEGAAADTPPAP